MANTATSAGASSAPTILQPVEESSPGFTRGDRFFSELKPVEISPELLDLTTKAFAKADMADMADIRRSYRAVGFPTEVINVLLASWSSSTQKRYQGPWKTWSQWCLARGLCPLSAPVTKVLTFLAEIAAQRGLEYRTIAVYKSAISQAHFPVGHSPLGELPVVSRFMKGIFRTKPPSPRLSCTWNVKPLLEYLSTLEPLSTLSMKQELTLKLATLLALTSAARAHELVKLDLDAVSKKANSWEFTILSHVKTSRPGHPPWRIYLPAYLDNQSICVIRALEAYQARTETVRNSTQLLISHIRLFGPITSQTFSRWLRKSLNLAGIDHRFTGHSTRSASTSSAAEAGLPLETILEAADWSSARTFERFYLKPSTRGDFAMTVLNTLST